MLAACTDPADAWDGVMNPILGFPDAAIKDAFLVTHEGTWHLGYSRITDDPFRFRLGFSSGADLVELEHAPDMDQPDTGGLASPDVVRAPDGTFVMTYNTHTRDVGEVLNKMYYRTSSDLVTWSEPQRFVIDGANAPEDRLIDAALAFTDDAGAFLCFKREQRANIAHSPSGSLAGPWTLIGELEGAAASTENCQLIQLDGTWHMLATKIPLLHAPVLHRLDGDSRDPAAWRRWTVVRDFEIPAQPWNDGAFLDHETSNASYLVDRRAEDGYAYLLYAGSTELTSFETRGHAKLGVARSRDLETWEPAPAR